MDLNSSENKVLLEVDVSFDVKELKLPSPVYMKFRLIIFTIDEQTNARENVTTDLTALFEYIV